MISNDFIIQRIGPGVRLAPPDKVNSRQNTSVASLFRLPLNFYFMDTESIMQRMNDQTARTSQYLSAEDAIGKSIRDVSDRETIAAILANDREVVNSKFCKIISESYQRYDGKHMTAISLKFPWLQNNTLAGIFGCSILLGDENTPSLSDALMMLMQTGLLSTSNMPAIPGLMINDEFFDQRDHDILNLLVRGKTAKKIALALGLSYRTIEHRLEAIKEKLKVSSKSELIELLVDQLLF